MSAQSLAVSASFQYQASRAGGDLALACVAVRVNIIVFEESIADSVANAFVKDERKLSELISEPVPALSVGELWGCRSIGKLPSRLFGTLKMMLYLCSCYIRYERLA